MFKRNTPFETSAQTALDSAYAEARRQHNAQAEKQLKALIGKRQSELTERENQTLRLWFMRALENEGK